MPATGSGKEQSSGGASSQGMEFYKIERPLSIFSSRENIYQKVHKFMTFGYSSRVIGSENTVALTTYLAEIPWHLPVMYLTPSEYNLLPDGTHVKALNISVKYRGSVIQFEVASSASGLATLNQINDIGVASAINKTGYGQNATIRSTEAGQPMVPLSITAPIYGPVAGYKGLVRQLYGDPTDFGFIPNHQVGRQSFLNNYYCMLLSQTGSAATLRESGWPALVEKIDQIDGKTAVNSEVLNMSYQPKMGVIKQPIKFRQHAPPFPGSIAVQGSLPNSRACTINITGSSTTEPLNVSNNETTSTQNNVLNSDIFSIYTPIEKSQFIRSGYWGEADAHIQPSAHIGVQPVPALTSTDTFTETNLFTDTRAYWEVTCTMITTDRQPTNYPFIDNPNIPFGESVVVGQSIPPFNLNPSNETATWGGLHTQSTSILPAFT